MKCNGRFKRGIGDNANTVRSVRLFRANAFRNGSNTRKGAWLGYRGTTESVTIGWPGESAPESDAVVRFSGFSVQIEHFQTRAIRTALSRRSVATLQTCAEARADPVGRPRREILNALPRPPPRRHACQVFRAWKTVGFKTERGGRLPRPVHGARERFFRVRPQKRPARAFQ